MSVNFRRVVNTKSNVDIFVSPYEMMVMVMPTNGHSRYANLSIVVIRESVDSPCDGVTLMQKPYNFTTNTQKGYLSIQASSLSAFAIG